MKQAITMALILLSLLATGCSRVKLVPQDVAPMGAANFTVSSVTVKAGAPVKFKVNGDGATHILVVGIDGKWQANTQAPADLNSSNGLTIGPGEEKDIPFPNPGTYQVTCTIHQSMLLTVTVNP